MSTDTKTSSIPELQVRRKRWLALVIGAFALIGVAYGAYWALTMRHVQSTDDAYVSGNVVQITPQIAGTVIAIGADDPRS
jgi:membrane fusion protein (multidrug efflux system)